jgi:DNA (cytosine-5)-methyltransferase 1
MKNLLLIHEVAEKVGVSKDTIRRWAKKGLIKSTRSSNNHRLFCSEEVGRLKSKLANGENDSKYEILKTRKTKFTALELFSGCGGMALGFENAGLKTLATVEIDKYAAATLKLNRPKWKVLDRDITELNKKKAFDSFRDKADIVAGGFPCQAFSYAGHSRGFGDPRGTLFFQLLKVVEATNPKIVIGENVRGLLKHDGGRTLSTIVSCLEDAGYKTTYRVLRAQFLDVPQKRERLIIMGVRKDLEYAHLFPREKDYTVTIGQALKNVPKSDGQSYPEKKHNVMKLVPPGGYWRDLPDSLQRSYMGASYFHEGGRTGMARRMSWDEPSLTLTCSPAQKQTERCHPEETRPFTTREYARIQTFPDDWQFFGSTNQIYKQIGNAVPVNLGYHLGRCLAAMLRGTKDVDWAEKMIPGEESGTDGGQLRFAL